MSSINKKFYAIIIDHHTKEILFEQQITSNDEFDARATIREEFQHRMKYAKKSIKLPLVASAWCVECVEI